MFIPLEIRLVRTTIPPLLVLICNISFAQPKDKIEIKLFTGSKYDLTTGTINADTAYVRVTTKDGHSVKDLSNDDFLITRNGDTASILSCTATTSGPANDIAITFILDNSGSMFHSYDSLTKYLDLFLDSIGEGFIANAMTFDNVERMPTYNGTNRGKLFIASSEFTSERDAIKEFWHSYDTIRTEFTPLYETIIKGLERIIDRRKSGDSLRKEIMIAITDGVDNASTISIERLSELATVMPIILFTVNLNGDPDGRLLWLASRTHGGHYVANDLHELRAVIEKIRKYISYSYKLVFQFPFRGARGTH